MSVYDPTEHLSQTISDRARQCMSGTFEMPIDVARYIARGILRSATVGAFDKIGADRLADEVAVLVRLGTLDARSPAADALLDYRDPPSTVRADRLAELEGVVLNQQDRLGKLERENDRLVVADRERGEKNVALNRRAQQAESALATARGTLEEIRALASPYNGGCWVRSSR